MEREEEVSVFQDVWACKLDKTYRKFKDLRRDYQRYGEHEIILYDNLNEPVVTFHVNEEFLANWQRRFVGNVAEDLMQTGAVGKQLVREIFFAKKPSTNPLREDHVSDKSQSDQDT